MENSSCIFKKQLKQTNYFHENQRLRPENGFNMEPIICVFPRQLHDDFLENIVCTFIFVPNAANSRMTRFCVLRCRSFHFPSAVSVVRYHMYICKESIKQYVFCISDQ